MARQTVLLQPSYLLHRRDYRNSSLLLEIFSRDHGRLCLVGKGVRRAQNKWRPYLQVFQPLHMSWVIASELGQLTGIEPAAAPLSLQRQALYSAFYLNELLMRLLTRHDPHERLFDAYAASLHALASTDSLESILRLFEKNLLAHLGYGLHFNRDSRGDPIEPDLDYTYLVEQGPVACHQVNMGHGQIRIKGASLLCLDRNDLPNSRKVMADIKSLMRYILQHYLGRHELHSRVLFQQPKASV